jgi:hypothetical protein
MGISQFPPRGSIPSGISENRPSNPQIGDTYYDGTLGFLMIYGSTDWVACSTPAAQPSITVTDVGTNIPYASARASVAFTEGATGGKAAGFTATTSVGGYSGTGALSPITVNVGTTGSYTFTGTAFNAFGVSAASASETITLTTVPQAPTINSVAPGESTQAIIIFTAGATGGKAITSYNITSSPASTTTTQTTSSTTYTFTGLTNETAYTFTVQAVNDNGTSISSAASSSVTPTDSTLVEYLVLAGGGGGGSGLAAGGGAGGYCCC